MRGAGGRAARATCDADTQIAPCVEANPNSRTVRAKRRRHDALSRAGPDRSAFHRVIRGA